MAMSFQNVYTFGPTFRAENSNTSRHLAEFWMVEPEIAFCDLEGDQNLAEEFLKYVFKYVLDHCPEDMAFFSTKELIKMYLLMQKISLIMSLQESLIQKQ